MTDFYRWLFINYNITELVLLYTSLTFFHRYKKRSSKHRKEKGGFIRNLFEFITCISNHQ
jgi:uncharacterized membrane protein